jgi:hypothetical protein
MEAACREGIKELGHINRTPLSKIKKKGQR